MRKRVSLFLVLMMLITMLLPVQVLAQYDKDMESAIVKAKSLFNITDQYDNFRYNVSTYDGKTIFNLMWNDTKNQAGNVNVGITSTGRVTSFYSYKPNLEGSQSKLPAIGKEDAKKIAADFFRKVNPDLAGQFEYLEINIPFNIQQRTYHLQFYRLANGIPYPANSMSIAIDSITGQVQSFYMNWTDDLVFPDAKEILSLEQAKQAFQEKLGLRLAYRLSYNGEEQKPYLVYTNVYENKAIDAKTGEIFSPTIDINGRGFGGEYELQSKAQAKAEDSLTPREREAVEGMAGMIPEKKAEELARGFLKLDTGYQASHISLFNDWQNKSDFIWNINFEKREDSKYYHASISLDAKTGELKSFYRSTPGDGKEPVKYDREQSLKIAKDYIKSIQAEKYDQVEYTDWNEQVVRPLDVSGEQPRQFSFTFTRKTNGAYFIGNGFNLTVDAVTGSITQYNFNWWKGELPAADKILSLEDAYKMMFDEIGIQLQYAAIYSSPDYVKKVALLPGQNQKPEVKLVYAVKPGKPVNLDANTGAILDYSGEPVADTNRTVEFSDIKGHYAEEKIKVLAEYGITLPGEEFRPDSDIIQKEFLYLLARSMNPYLKLQAPGESDKDIDELYNYCMNAGIIKEGEKSPEVVVTRLDAVKFIIRAMRFEKVAKITGIYSLPFRDAGEISEEMQGYAAIAYGMNIVKGQDGYFNPAQNLNRAQTMILLYNYLNVN